MLLAEGWAQKTSVVGRFNISGSRRRRPCRLTQQHCPNKQQLAWFCTCCAESKALNHNCNLTADQHQFRTHVLPTCLDLPSGWK